ncbi:hypothetical protein LTR66_005446 [Elasticomyces elasticus]|nr:hypothetical protein LTR66_005446 [Elasticomyces elasticus]
MTQVRKRTSRGQKRLRRQRRAQPASSFYKKRVPAQGPDSEDRLTDTEAQHMSAKTYTERTMQKELLSDLRDYPSLSAETQQEITRKYQQLHQTAKDEGFYDCPYVEYGKELARYSALFTLSIIALRAEWYITSAVFLGLFWHQIMFTAHDAGHMAITHNFVADSLMGMFIADFCCGLSMGWWKSSHNVHHLVTNHPVSNIKTSHIKATADVCSLF